MSTTMENFMRSETITLDHASSGAFSQIPPKTPSRNSGDVDFNDVFGGPPRRCSTHEARVRYSFGDIVASTEDDGSSSPWNGRKGKPVFRVDNVGRSRYPSDDFFDDIFRGDDCNGSPRSFDRDIVMAPSPSLRITSPVSKAEFFGTSLPPPLSLSSKSTRLSPRAPQNHGQFKMDGAANQLNSPRSSSSSSRFYHRSPLASFSSEDSSSTVTSDLKNNVDNFKKGNRSGESPTADNQFHFSIYKWAGKGVPMLTPLVDRKNFKNTSKSDRASSNGKINGDFTRSKSSTGTNRDMSADVERGSLKTKCGSEDSRSKEETRELQYSVDAPSDNDIIEPKTQGIAKNSAVSGEGEPGVKAEIVKSRDDINTVNKVEKEVLVKPEAKPLRAFLVDDVEQQGETAEIKENETGAPKVKILYVHDSESVKKTEEGRNDSNRKDIDKSNLQGVAENSAANLGRSGAKGKVMEFVQIFNHEAGSRPKPDIPMRSNSHRWKAAGVDHKENEVNVNESKVKEKVESNVVEKKPDVSFKVEKNLNKDEARLKPQTKNPSFRKSFRRDSKVSVENADDPFEDYFSVQELSPDHETVAQRDELSEEMKAIDAKIRQWAVGKKGNIRSLLSTLQFVLWPGNGWKPVALVDLIEANAVKRAYQKALLRLHPDKLQQNSAASNQKYIAEKVFDLLQEAWDHFNTLAPL